MGVDLRTTAIVGGAVALPMLVARLHLDGARAGAANTAAAGALGEVDGVRFDVPGSFSMVDAWRSMKDALAAASSDSSSWAKDSRAHAVWSMWLDAYKAGAAADPVNYALYGSNDAVGADAEISPLGSLTSVDLCGGDVPFVSDGALWHPLGRAVCALYNAKAGDLANMVTLSGAVATAMDDADFRRDGDRRSDIYGAPSILELPGRVVGFVVGKFADAVLPSPVMLAALGIAAFVAWRHFK